MLTIMAGDPPETLPDTPIVRELHQRWQAGSKPVSIRREEDTASAQVIGANVAHREFTDCVYRQVNGKALYPSEESLFGEIAPDDPLPDNLSVESLLLPLLFPGVNTLYAPLGVGHHVDHQIVRNWALEIRERHPNMTVYFYEEYPYTRNQSAIEAAKANLPASLTLTQHQQRFDFVAISAKIQAISCHRSQLSTFWANQHAMIQEVKEMFNIGDQLYGERFWRIN